MGWELGRVGDFIKSKVGIHRMVFKKQGVGWRLGKMGWFLKKSDRRLGIMLDGWFYKNILHFFKLSGQLPDISQTSHQNLYFINIQVQSFYKII